MPTPTSSRRPTATLAIDTGFIVHNQRTYPTLLRLFAELGVATQDVRDVDVGRATTRPASSRPARSAPPACSRPGGDAAPPAYLRMLTEIPRFHRRARALLAAGEASTASSTTSRTRRCATSCDARRLHRRTSAGTSWSRWSPRSGRATRTVALDYPARYLFTFLEHHGMLGVFGSPQWRTVTGGSREYVDAVAAGLARRPHSAPR